MIDILHPPQSMINLNRDMLLLVPSPMYDAQFQIERPVITTIGYSSNYYSGGSVKSAVGEAILKRIRN